MELFAIHCRFQIAAICVFAIIFYSYMCIKKLPLMSTRCFTVVFFCETAYLVFDLLSVFTLCNIDVISEQFNLYAHRGFYISLLAVLASAYLYVYFLSTVQQKSRVKGVLFAFVPLAIGVAGVFLGSIEYYNDGTNIIYSSGTAVYILYVMIAVYLGAMLYCTGKLPSKDTRVKIRFGIGIWVIAAIIQFVFKELLISGLATVLLILFLYLSFENPSELIDAETNTFNKRGFRLMLAEEMSRKRTFYVLNIVIDDLPSVEHNFGHAKRNQLLGTLGGLLVSAAHTRVYRTRSSTMSLMLTNQNLEKTLVKITDILGKEWAMDCITNIRVAAHVDVIECPKYATNPDQICDMMNYLSDIRMKTHDTCYVRYVDEDVIKDKKRRATIEEMVKLAIVNDGLDVVYQPIFSTVDKCFSSAEALVRLKDKTTIGFVSPEEFIPIAEKAEVIGALGNIVIEKVCRFAKENNLMENGVKYIEVNLSGIQSIDLELPETMLGILAKYDIPPSFINFEITETAVVESGEQLHVNMTKLKDMGSSFSMDDFGTGYSNLSQMAKVRYDLIKLDKSLIWPCFDAGDANCAQANIILSNIVKMVISLETGIVAEGVETKEQFELLKAIGVEHMQGYYFSRPIPENDYLTFVREKNLVTA